jgi:ADP-heptose:LPS heptosyltransferase
LARRAALFLTPRLPWPLDDGGRIVGWQTLWAASEHHDVTVLSLVPEGGAVDIPPPALSARGVTVEWVTHRPPPVPVAAVRGLLGRWPYTLARYRNPEFTRRLRERVAALRPAYAIANHLHMAPYVEALGGVPMVLRAHNLEHRWMERHARELGALPAAWYARTQAGRLRRAEGALCRAAALVLAIQEQEAEALRALAPGARVETVPIGVDLDGYRPRSPAAPPIVLLAGSFAWRPNVDGALRFLAEGWPGIREAVPGARLRIAGKRPAGPLLRAARRPASPARILVVKLDHLGDVVLATPALRALRAAHPSAEIDALVAPGPDAVLAGSPDLNRILLYDSPRFRRPSAPRASGAASALRDVACARYDVVVELRGDWSTLSLAFRVGATRRVDRGTVRFRDWLDRRTGAGRTRPRLHEVETNLEIVRPLLAGPVPKAPRVQTSVSPEAAASLSRKLAAAGIDERAPIVCMHPGAAWRPRAWRSERFARVAAWIRERYRAQVVFVGSNDERDIESALRAACPADGVHFLFGTLTVPEVVALFARARLLVGNDSGLAHLAAARGLPSVVLFGPQDPARFRPWSDGTVVLHHRVPCFPCRQTVCVRPDLPCVNLIEVEEVERAVRDLWEGGSGAPPAV